MLTMRRRLLLVAVPLVVLITAPAGGDVTPQQPSATSPTIDPTCPRGLHSVGDFRAYAARVYRRPTVTARAQGRLAYMKKCQHSPWAKGMVKRYATRYKREREARQERARVAAAIAAVATFQCDFGRFAIPCYIVACESTNGSWTVENEIGAKGPYQFLGKPVIDNHHWPVDSVADKLAHHRLARTLWAGGAGSHHWAECLD